MLCFNYTVGFSLLVAVLDKWLYFKPVKIIYMMPGRQAHFSTSIRSQCPVLNTIIQSHSLFQSYET